MTSADILAQIPDAHTRWPDWFERRPLCRHCGSVVSESDRGQWTACFCWTCRKDVTGETDGAGQAHIGPDLLSPVNLVAVLEVCDHVFAYPPSIGYDDSLKPSFGCKGSLYQMPDRNAIRFCGTGPTRHAACLAALVQALGLEEKG